ncbi:MAG: two-component sensor histidine kinase [Burkholderiales bacterium 35-55-47]|nr:MAG: two-component sensor histidine kinase [Burkholderiales bacterium 35-55-47]OYZ74882.1 MAG: two-component sensor histidine kinase [Burkholderiales bacterium 24-55-52]OZB02210.1 MAG: two-component sensor histidine kinase [Burkholderiales bacterium 39-55-53]
MIHFGIRSKLIALFVAIKVLPLILLAYFAWQGVERLGHSLSQETEYLADEVKTTVADMSARFAKESVRALDDRAREELERLTTDTARAVADFLYDRDRDILLVATLPAHEKQYQQFLDTRTRYTTPTGKWQLTADGQAWESQTIVEPKFELASSLNAENLQDFHSRPPEGVRRSVPSPLYYELTYIDLNGHEVIKASRGDVLPKGLRDVSVKANTWSKAETYFQALKSLKLGQIYVSEVIGPYVPSRIIGPVTPTVAQRASLPFAPAKEAYAGQENPYGQQFQGIVRWATPVVKDGAITGYVTLALNHAHLRSFTDHLTPTPERYTAVPDASSGNYAFMWDHKDRNIAHPRHHSITGFDPNTGEYATPWLEDSIYQKWQASKQPLSQFLRTVRTFDDQSRDKKPAKELTRSGNLGLDCRYLNFAPQCQGWHDLTQQGGSGSFLILWSGVWKRTTAAVIPYYTGQYANSPRGFGYVTIGANIEDFHAPAVATADLMNEKVNDFTDRLRNKQISIQSMIEHSVNETAANLTGSTLIMLILVVVVAVWLASLLTRHVTDLVQGLARIEGGDFSFRFQRGTNDELGHLNNSLNHMADSVQASFERSESARRQAEDNSQMKSDFVANVSHELRTPLNGILGFSEIILEDAKDSETREFAQTIHQSGQHLLSVVNDMLDVAKIEAGHMTLEPVVTQIRALLNEVALLHTNSAEQKGLKLHTLLEDDLPEQMCTDPTRLRQVINNLLSNAVKFTAKGEVTLSARWVDQQLIVGVRDTGAGIAPHVQEVVFERFRQATSFVTREHGGTGLGLALVREFIKLMGGELRLTSQLGLGSYFEFSVPELNRATRVTNLDH